ncbi:hybrid sensor histidine kinase/response regulator [Pseudoduganella armeniaca]|uniref:histidine kinase n=1 Tax=Pseudoduganella armeniaca TaxID=2072590 RepID=A0A2R4C952_9BURK|nr:hybrid sensor histidine kinase/response regulator [Pseudoduganella armeniaca]AVR96082.1 hybrid sensor histidine kinase/response regulator [Pseudoduganella armeniaca]
MADRAQPDSDDATLREAQLRAALVQVRSENAQLREANAHLVMATVNAQSLQDEAEAANRRQNEFLAMLAHELRNPLAPISMAAAMLERMPQPTPELAALRGVISRQVEHMARLLDDLLDAARISSGKITLTIAPLALGDVVERALETVQPRIAERRQQLRVALHEPALALDGDKVRLTQVLSNLLGNASKYTQDGGTVGLRSEACELGVRLIVSDDGTGIGPDVLPHIFDLFTQGPRSLARSEGGLGVGLNVVRNLVQMHGGTVQAHSDGIGLGSRFTIELPVGAAEAVPAAEDTVASPAHDACKVLLIEDNVDVCDTLKSFLMLDRHVVTAAYDGSQGLALALTGDFDVLLCDIGLPQLDGLEVIARLRAQEADAARTRRLFAIALSGYGQPEDRARALAAGFDEYLVKPVRPDSLLELVAAACR